MAKSKIIKCNTCKKNFDYYNSKFRPFCSERCKMVDLGKWFNEEYTLKSNEHLSDIDLERCIEEQDIIASDD